QPGLQPRVARDVEHLLAVLLHAAADHVLDGAGIDPGAVDHLGERLPEQLVRVRVLVVALLAMAAPDRRADGFDDDDFTTGIHCSGNLRMLKVGLISVGVDSSVNREIDTVSERIGIAGGGAIASGLACVAAEHGQVVLWARRPDAATARVERLIERRGGVGAGNVAVSSDLDVLLDATFIVEAIAEEPGAKSDLLARLGGAATNGTILATTTS